MKFKIQVVEENRGILFMKSMTGFGRSKLEENSREYIVEIKSVNHKYSDI